MDKVFYYIQTYDGETGLQINFSRAFSYGRCYKELCKLREDEFYDIHEMRDKMGRKVRV